MAQVGGGEYAGTAGVGTAGSATAGAGAARARRSTVGAIGRRPPLEQTVEHDTFDWERLAVFGAGLALGALFGAGVTAFTVPLSGPAARRAVRRRARRAIWRSQDAWEDLRDEFAAATLRRKKQIRRRRRGLRDSWDTGRDRL